jgi:hypothetical protein
VFSGHYVACHATDPTKIEGNKEWQKKYEKEVVAK